MAGRSAKNDARRDTRGARREARRARNEAGDQCLSAKVGKNNKLKWIKVAFFSGLERAGRLRLHSSFFCQE